MIVTTDELDLSSFLAKVQAFGAGEPRTGGVARVHELHPDATRLERVLSEEMLRRWPTLDDNAIYVVDVGVACLGDTIVPEPPARDEDETDEHFTKRLDRWTEKKIQAELSWDDLKVARESAIEQFVTAYGGEIPRLIDAEVDGVAYLPDSFTARIRISGRGLRDLALNFPFVFEITEPDEADKPESTLEPDGLRSGIALTAPAVDAPAVCVIDSGIQEGHRLLSPAIDATMSRCYIPGTPLTDVADYCANGGHGTRVAGAVIYKEVIPDEGSLALPTWIQNARVLDSLNALHPNLLPPAYLRAITNRYHSCDRHTRIFNHSITGTYPCRTRHMSAWAAEMDLLSYEYDVLFIQAGGNLKPTSQLPFALGIREHLAAGREYPTYLMGDLCRIPNPAQSLQALTVGSIAYEEFNDGTYQSLADDANRPSCFSRTGLGIWGVVKPDVVEYGGEYVRDTGSPPNLSIQPATCPDLVRASGQGPSPEHARDNVGTSFAAPKVAHLAARLQATLPDEPTLLYRALIAQSARWPGWTDGEADTLAVLRHIGYGLPDEERATSNSPYRVTLITHGFQWIAAREAQVFQIPIPRELRRPGEAHLIRIDITLSYAAQPRRTRRNPRGYLSTWLDWTTSSKNESLDAFVSKVLREETRSGQRADGIPWTLHVQENRGTVRGASRNVGTLQKDWAYIQSHHLPEIFSVAVVAHPGWSKDPDSRAKYSLAVSFESVGQELEIYEPIRTAVEALLAVPLTAEVDEEIELGAVS